MARQYSTVENDIDRFLNELGADVIDIALLHAVTDRRLTEKFKSAMEALSIAKKVGKV